MSIRSSIEYNIHPSPQISRLSVSAERYFGYGKNAWRLRGESLWERNERKFNHTIALGKQFNALNLDIFAESDGDSDHRAGLTLSFSIGRKSKGWGITSRPLASAGTVRAYVFEDLDDSGGFSPGDKPIEKAAILSSNGAAMSSTNSAGIAILDSISVNTGTAITVATDELDDPNLYARPTYTRAREGTVSEIAIALTQMGNIEGTVEMISGFDPKASPLGGVTLVLLNAQQKEVGRTLSAYDGYYSFDLVPVGEYSVILAPDTSLSTRLRPVVPVLVKTNRDDPSALGAMITLIETNPTSTRMALRGLL